MTVNDPTIKSVASYLLTAVVGRALAMLGAALVTHGIATEDQVSQQIAPLTQYIVGGLFVLGAMGQAWWLARQRHENDKSLAVTPPSQIKGL